MSAKRRLSLDELIPLLHAKFAADKVRMAKGNELMFQKLGKKLPEKDALTKLLESKFAELIPNLLARKMTEERGASELFTDEDVNEFMPVLIDCIVQQSNHELDSNEIQIFQKMIRMCFNACREIVLGEAMFGKNPIDESWKWVDNVLDMAAERKISATELLALESTADELTRRLFTKEQFIEARTKKFGKYLDTDVIKEIVLTPLLASIPEFDEEDRAELTKLLEANIMPEIRKMVEDAKPALASLLNEEVERIYKAA